MRRGQLGGVVDEPPLLPHRVARAAAGHGSYDGRGRGRGCRAMRGIGGLGGEQSWAPVGAQPWGWSGHGGGHASSRCTSGYRV